jgi:hypothetical protein
MLRNMGICGEIYKIYNEKYLADNAENPSQVNKHSLNKPDKIIISNERT